LQYVPSSFCSLPLLIFSSILLNAAAPTEFYTLSLHDALPIFLSLDERKGLFLLPLCPGSGGEGASDCLAAAVATEVACHARAFPDRKSTRLNSSHLGISYAVFCLKKKNRSITGLPNNCCSLHP